jgi:hypothetical protein
MQESKIALGFLAAELCRVEEQSRRRQTGEYLATQKKSGT